MISAVSRARSMRLATSRVAPASSPGAGQPVTQGLGLSPAPLGEALAGLVTGHDAVDGRPALAVTDQHQAGQGFVRHGLKGRRKTPDPIRDQGRSGPYSWLSL